MTKCQSLRKFWHLELFWRDLHVIRHLVIFRADQLKKPPCINERYHVSPGLLDPSLKEAWGCDGSLYWQKGLTTLQVLSHFITQVIVKKHCHVSLKQKNVRWNQPALKTTKGHHITFFIVIGEKWSMVASSPTYSFYIAAQILLGYIFKTSHPRFIFIPI